MSEDSSAASPGDFEDIEYTVEDGLAQIVIDRQEKGNTLRPETLAEVDDARALAEAADDVRVLAIRTAGDRFFSSGADLNSVLPIIESEDSDAVVEFNEQWHRVYDALENSPLPVIAGVSGQALAGGLELTLVCDLVVATPEATFGDQHINFNLIGGGGATQRLSRIVGVRRSKELLLTGDAISAETAKEWGLVNRVTEEGESLEEAVAELGTRMAEHHPLALKRQKYLANESLRTTLDDGLKLEREMANIHLMSSAANEGLQRFMDR